MSFANEPLDLSSAWTRRLREMSSFPCPFCKEPRVFRQDAQLLEHIEAEHPDENARRTADAGGPGAVDAYKEEVKRLARQRGCVFFSQYSRSAGSAPPAPI